MKIKNAGPGFTIEMNENLKIDFTYYVFFNSGL